jgi:PAS domain S-box-containing protein
VKRTLEVRLVRPAAITALAVGLLWLGVRAGGGGALWTGGARFMPHGYCYLWDPLLLWLHVVSDALIALSYYCIPVVLIYFIRKNRDIPFNRIFWMFGTFILACGTTHLLEIWNVWHGAYLLAGMVKAATAGVSVITAAMLIPLVPKALSVPARLHLVEVNRKLREEIAERKRYDAPVDAALRRRVTGGLIVAVLFTIFLGFATWSGARRGEQDGYWVTHTHEVREAIQRTSREVIEAETSARAFALSGQEPLLAHYQTAHDTIYRDEDALRHLTADNPEQQRRIEVLHSKIGAALDLADNLIAKRHKTGANPGAGDALEIERHLDRVRATTKDMYDEETRLLGQRLERAGSGQRLTRVIALVGVIFGSGLWALGWMAVKREINISQRARTQLSVLNGELERRVEQRTAALQGEIAERKKAAEARERLAAVVDSSDDAIISKTLEGTITSWNRGAEKMFGYAAAEVMGKPMLLLFPPERAKEEADILGRIRRGQSVDHFETERVRKDGQSIYVSATISPIRDNTGRIVGASKIARDITEQKRAEETLREQAKVLDLAQVMVRDLSGRITLWKQGAEKLYGYTREEAVGRISHELLQTQFPETLEKIDEELERTGSWEGELVHRKRDHTSITVSSLWVLHRDSAGKAQRVLEANADITRRKQAEEQLAGQAEELSRQAGELVRSREELEAQKRMLQSVLDSMSEGLVATDEQGKFILWNPAAQRIVGMGPAEMSPEQWNTHYGVYLPDAVTPFPPEHNPLLRAIRGEAGTAELFLSNRSMGGGIWIEINGSPLKDKNGILRGGVVAFRDITKRRADEREIRKLNEELESRVVERTEQLQAANAELEAFSYSISHDLRAPLRHISGFSKILTEDFAPSLPEEAQRYLQRIEQGASRMGQLVDELLNLTRVGRQALAMRRTALDEIARDVISMLEPESAGRKVEWKIGRLPIAECDPILIRQVFQNLIGNALKYSRPRSPAVVEIGQTEADGQPVIFVRDNGVGFNMKYADKLFGVFQRLHRAEEFEGTGVGLATVQRIVQKHGGRIWAEAAIDRGSTFYFTLGGLGQSASKNAAAGSGGS